MATDPFCSYVVQSLIPDPVIPGGWLCPRMTFSIQFLFLCLYIGFEFSFAWFNLDRIFNKQDKKPNIGF